MPVAPEKKCPTFFPSISLYNRVMILKSNPNIATQDTCIERPLWVLIHSFNCNPNVYPVTRGDYKHFSDMAGLNVLVQFKHLKIAKETLRR